MKTADFDYNLPEELIAQQPAEPRDSSRLMVVDRGSGRIEHSEFRRLGEYLQAGDLLVANDTRVIQARVRARRSGTGGRVEFLLLRRLSDGVWQGVGRPGRRMRPGERYKVEGADVGVEVRGRAEDGTLTLRLSSEEGMEEWGETPLPPYIREPLGDAERYQTVYAREPGSAAAPTAGLHFTRELMEGLEVAGGGPGVCDAARGVGHVSSCHGGGPTTTSDSQGVLPAGFGDGGEDQRLSDGGGGRVVAVGTTSVRTLEQAGIWLRGEGEEGRRAGFRVGGTADSAGVQFSDGGRDDDELSPAAINDADDDGGIRGQEAADGGVRRSDTRAVPVLQLWGCDADSLIAEQGWGMGLREGGGCDGDDNVITYGVIRIRIHTDIETHRRRDENGAGEAGRSAI